MVIKMAAKPKGTNANAQAIMVGIAAFSELKTQYIEAVFQIKKDIKANRAIFVFFLVDAD